MEWVDTHCHIHEASTATGGDAFVRDKWAKAGFTDTQQLVDEAVAAGVTQMICVGCTLRDSQLAVELANQNEHCWAAVGIHPHEAKDHLDVKTQQAFADLVTAKRVVAIGECGLDYYYTHSSKQDQLQVLRFQLDLAVEHDLPVIFHVRDAFDDFWPVLDHYQGKIRGVLHSYTDDMANLKRAIDMGLYIGVNGIATFNKDPQKSVTYVTIPQQSLLLETDAPFLTPTPYRGTICQPKHIVRTAEFLAGLRGEDLATIAKHTTQNAHNLFSLN